MAISFQRERQSFPNTDLRLDAFAARYEEHYTQNSRWTISDLSFSRDVGAWNELTVKRKAVLAWVVERFFYGERVGTAVSARFVEFLRAQSSSPLSSYYEKLDRDEGKHSVSCDSYLQAVGAGNEARTAARTPAFSTLFDDYLKNRMAHLESEPTKENLIRFLVAYHFVAEGLAAMVGIVGIRRAFVRDGINLPAMTDLFQKIGVDECRHIALGIEALRLVIGFERSPRAGLNGLKIMISELRYGLRLARAVSKDTFEHFDPFPFAVKRKELIFAVIHHVIDWIKRTCKRGAPKHFERVIGLDLG